MESKPLYRTKKASVAVVTKNIDTTDSAMLTFQGEIHCVFFM